MITLNNESLAWDPLKIWLQAWTSHSGSCSPRCHHMIWGAPKKLLTEVDNYTNHFLRSRKKGKTHSIILRNFKSVAKKWFTEWTYFYHIFCTPFLNRLFLNVKRTLKKWSSWGWRPVREWRIYWCSRVKWAVVHALSIFLPTSWRKFMF